MHNFRVGAGCTVLQLKELMVSPNGTREDVDSIELRQLGKRVPDWEVIRDEATLDFELLQLEEGARRAAEDVALAGNFGDDRQQLQYERKAPVEQKLIPADPQIICSASAAPARSSAPSATPAPARAPVARPIVAPAAPAPAHAAGQRARWEVIGGADKGGILVRTGQELKSPAASGRLSTGAIVEELALVGERLQYRLAQGSGPHEGWVSIRITSKDLLRCL